MNENKIWNQLFSKSFFFGISTEEGAEFLSHNIDKIDYDKTIESFHPNRKDEFLLGRLCAYHAHKLCTGHGLRSLPKNLDRSPDWPQNIVGSISHSKNWVGACVGWDRDLIGVGLDFEILGRTKLELASQIRNSKDLLRHVKLSDEELLTIIFSCKESLYKALYPSVKKFFGFEDAALRELDLEHGSFLIELLSPLNSELGPHARHLFYGKLGTYEGNCLSVLEILQMSK